MTESCKVFSSQQDINRECLFTVFFQCTHAKRYLMKLAADELKTDKRRWFSTEHVIKLQNFLPQELKEAKHYISAEGNCCFMDEESSNANTYSTSGNPASANCWGLREYSGEVLLYIYCVLTRFGRYLLLVAVRGYLNGHGSLGLAQYSCSFVVKPALLPPAPLFFFFFF